MIDEDQNEERKEKESFTTWKFNDLTDLNKEHIWDCDLSFRTSSIMLEDVPGILQSRVEYAQIRPVRKYTQDVINNTKTLQIIIYPGSIFVSLVNSGKMIQHQKYVYVGVLIKGETNQKIGFVIQKEKETLAFVVDFESILLENILLLKNEENIENICCFYEDRLKRRFFS